MGPARLMISEKIFTIQETGRRLIYTLLRASRPICSMLKASGDWLIGKGFGRCTMEDARKLSGEYIKSFESAYSQKTVRSALARVFGCTGADLCDVADRRAEDIKRGRVATKRTEAIERNHPEELEVCRSTGVRHNRELWQIQPQNFWKDKVGNLYLHLVGKGGRPRDALILGAGRDIIERDLASGRFQDGEQMYTVPSHTNVHACRADYAARCYRYAMEHGYASGEMYRGFDKGAISFVDKNLGHGGNRMYTAVVNYLSYGNDQK